MTSLQKMMSPERGRGKELFELLKREFALPEQCFQFEVSFEMNEPVMVRCTYLALETDDDRAR